MDSKTNTDKIPIRGWLILVAVTLWLTAIGSVLVFILSLTDGLPWLESLLIIVTATLSIIALALLRRQKRKFVPWFLALIAWSVLSAVVSAVLGFTSISSFVYIVIGSIILSPYVVRSERVKNTFGVKPSERVTRMTWFVAPGLVVVCLGRIIFYTYPRHIALAIKGVEYKLGAPQQGVKPVSLQLNGTLHRPLWGKRTFDGTTRQFYMYGYLYANKSFTKLLS